MNSTRASALLVFSALLACGASPTTTEAGSTATTISGADAGSVVDASATDPLEIFLEAARTNLERPYPASQRGSRARYRDAANALLGVDRFHWDGRAATHVANVLATVEEDRARQALMAWAAMPAAREYLPEILPRMMEHPRAEYLATCNALLDDPTLAAIVYVSFENPSGLLGDALEMNVAMSVHGLALGVALSLPGPEGAALVRRYAMDRARSAPDPRTLRALACKPGQVRVELEAQAAASLRILALSMLRDRALLAAVAADATEPALVRHWARRILRGRLDRSVDPRAHRNYELSMIEYVGRDDVPCMTVQPHPQIPKADDD